MFEDIPILNEDIQLDPSLLKMDPNKKYRFVLNVYRKSDNYSEAFKVGARYILFFAKSFESLNVFAFRAMVHKYRGLFKHLPTRTDEDKKYMLLLYIELWKTNTTMTKREFFERVLEKDELNDFWPFYVYFGRLFAAEEDYHSLEMVVDKARLELKSNFHDIAQLVALEGMIPTDFKYTRTTNVRGDSIIHMFKAYANGSYQEVFISEHKHSNLRQNEDFKPKEATPKEPAVVEDSGFSFSFEGVESVPNSKNGDKGDTSAPVISINGEDGVDNVKEEKEKEINDTGLGDSSLFSKLSEIKTGFDKSLENVNSNDNGSEAFALSQYGEFPPITFDFFNQTPLDGGLDVPSFLSSPDKPRIKRFGGDDSSEEQHMDDDKESSYVYTQNVFTNLLFGINDQNSADDFDYSPLKKKGRIRDEEQDHLDKSMHMDDDFEEGMKERLTLGSGEPASVADRDKDDNNHQFDNSLVNIGQEFVENWDLGISSTSIKGSDTTDIHTEEDHLEDKSEAITDDRFAYDLRFTQDVLTKPPEVSTEPVSEDHQSLVIDSCSRISPIEKVIEIMSSHVHLEDSKKPMTYDEIFIADDSEEKDNNDCDDISIESREPPTCKNTYDEKTAVCGSEGVEKTSGDMQEDPNDNTEAKWMLFQ
uniref:BUB1 N-terminal domain-containing protein n=1 Tax=Strongyloides papillosus TaxID=174720 RepID=A0A0N5BMC6_STREA